VEGDARSRKCGSHVNKLDPLTPVGMALGGEPGARLMAALARRFADVVRRQEGDGGLDAW
jgi:hypothetical protein